MRGEAVAWWLVRLSAIALLLGGCAANHPAQVDAGGSMDAGARDRDGGAMHDAGPGPDDAGWLAVDGGADAGRGSGAICSACTTHADCARGHWCAALTVGGRACVPSCVPDVPTCPRLFNCVDDVAAGVPDTVCEPVGGPCCVDEDGDGYGAGVGCLGTDCDDGDDTVHPDQPDSCNGVDDDCDGVADEDGGTETLCADGEDNDCDGLIDCTDTSCNTMPCGINGRVCDGGACVCPTGSVEVCTDGADNDCDGLADCADPDCNGMGCGANGRRCASLACGCPGGSVETACSGGVDDDCDGVIDCADSDCAGRSCGADGRVCNLGTASCGCAGSSELCNGVDDDCDGTVDEGCPSSLGRGAATTGSTYGGSGGAAFTTDCASGAALGGINGRAASRLDQVAGVCRALSLSANTTTSPEHTYTLATGASTTLAAQGGTGGTPFSDACAAHEVIIGIEGRSGSEVDRLSFVCGTVRLTRSGSSFTATVTETSTSPSRGGTGGSAFSYRCPAGRVAVGLYGRDGTRIDQIGLRCAPVTFTLR